MAGTVTTCLTLSEWNQQYETCKQTNDLYVVHFHCEYFVPSVELAQGFDAIAGNYPSVFFLRVDIDGCKQIANIYRVRAFPQVHFIKHGKRIAKVRKMTQEVPPVPPATEKGKELKNHKVDKVTRKIARLS